jgi:phosphoadenosine phosphosulfate reductase
MTPETMSLSLPEREQLARLSASLEDKTPQDILAWSAATYRPRLAMATAFGAEGCVLLAMLAERGLQNDVHLFNLNTGYQFTETLATRDRLQEKYGFWVHLVPPDDAIFAAEAESDAPLYARDPDRCCYLRKVLPLQSYVARGGFDAWISAIRRDQTPDRAGQPIVGWDAKFGLVKINPLANWSKRAVWEYITRNGVPYNPLMDQGYPSIGCRPCTRPVGAGEDERAGRWSGRAKTECGLHLVSPSSKQTAA